MAESFTNIPTIDLSQANDPATLPALLQDLRTALTEVGFLYVINHDVPVATIDSLVHLLPRLFALSEAGKAAVALEQSPSFLGYSGPGSESTAGAADAREQFEFATELPPVQWRAGLPLYERLPGPNQWPLAALPELKPVVEAYVAAMTALGERFLRLVAQALELADQPDVFLPFLSDQHRLKLVHYPAAEDGGQGVGPHKDSSGWWTFLLQASPPEVKGLQVLNKAGAWVDVPVLPGSFVVNIGQAFEVVTHGVCRATTHRVLTSADERYSVPFFQGVRRSLTKAEALGALQEHMDRHFPVKHNGVGVESDEARAIDSAFLQGKYDTWGETQLRTKVRSHRAAGKRFYPEVYDQYINDS